MKKGSGILAFGARCIAVVTLSVIFAAAVSAGITLDNRSSQGVFSSTPSPNALSWNHAVNTCTNCVLYIGVTTYSSVLDVLPVLTITYTNNGTSYTPTSIGNQLSPPGTGSIPPTGNSSVQIYRLIAPPTGTGTISVSSSVSTNYLFGSSFSFNGVNQTTPNGTWNSASGNSNSPDLTVTGDASGSVILDILGSGPGAGFFSAASGQTVCSPPTDPFDETTCTRGRRFYSTSFDVGAMSYKYATAPGTVDQWTMANSAPWALGAIAITYDGTTAGEACVQGQLVTAGGRGVSGANVYAQDNAGNMRTARSNPFGYFRFEGLNSGETYILSAHSKSYDFQPVGVTINESVSGIQMVALERGPSPTPKYLKY